MLEKLVEAQPDVGPAVHVVSFGFKHGVPASADLLFDVRFLPNPYFEPTLRDKDGRDPEIEEYLFAKDQTSELLDRLDGFLEYLMPHYSAEGKSNLTIGIGCTGGRHRSVLIANHVGERLRARHDRVRVSHRDVDSKR